MIMDVLFYATLNTIWKAAANSLELVKFYLYPLLWVRENKTFLLHATTTPSHAPHAYTNRGEGF